MGYAYRPRGSIASGRLRELLHYSYLSRPKRRNKKQIQDGHYIPADLSLNKSHFQNSLNDFGATSHKKLNTFTVESMATRRYDLTTTPVSSTAGSQINKSLNQTRELLLTVHRLSKNYGLMDSAQLVNLTLQLLATPPDIYSKNYWKTSFRCLP